MEILEMTESNKQQWLKDFAKLKERHDNANLYMSREDITQEQKMDNFAKYKCECIDVLENYLRLFMTYGIKINLDTLEEEI